MDRRAHICPLRGLPQKQTFRFAAEAFGNSSKDLIGGKKSAFPLWRRFVG